MVLLDEGNPVAGLAGFDGAGLGERLLEGRRPGVEAGFRHRELDVDVLVELIAAGEVETVKLGKATRITTASLHDELAALGGRLIVQALAQAEQGPLAATPQPSEGVNYAHKIEKHEALIDWSHSATEIARRIRAFDPFPGACTTLQGETIKLWHSQIESCSRLPGGA